MNMLLLGNLRWPDFLLEDLGPWSWPEKEKSEKRDMDCDLMFSVKHNFSIPFFAL